MENIRPAAAQLSQSPTSLRRKLLEEIALGLRASEKLILEANHQDLTSAENSKLSTALVDRLTLTSARIDSMCQGVLQVAAQPDRLGQEIEAWDRPNGLRIHKVRVPLGVILMIYEARPNVTVDAASLCLYAGNAVLLRGSSSAANSNHALFLVLRAALKKVGLPESLVQFISGERQELERLLKLHDMIDVVIPRGGHELKKYVFEHSTIPVLETGAGNCHLFLDESAPVEMAVSIALNAKTQRPGVCNAVETILVHRAWATKHLNILVSALKEKKVEIRACEQSRMILPELTPASEADWDTEFLDLIVALKIVDSTDQAIEHIQTHGTKHSEAIITTHPLNADRFLATIDAAVVYHNASTRFTDGFEFGFGAEIGISTQKLHARGPVGISELTTYKYVVRGGGQVR